MIALLAAGSQIRYLISGTIKTVVFTALFVLLSIAESSAFIDDIWQEYTPGKNIIGAGEDGRGIYLYYQSGELNQLREWYFYKGHVLGRFISGNDEKYFILNEKSKQLALFDLRKGFESEVKARGLKPVFTRTYSYKWSLFPKESTLNYATAFIFLFSGSIPFLVFQLLVFGMVCVIMFFRGQLKDFVHSFFQLTISVVRAVLWVSLFAVPIVLLCWYFKGAFPQSI